MYLIEYITPTIARIVAIIAMNAFIASTSNNILTAKPPSVKAEVPPKTYVCMVSFVKISFIRIITKHDVNATINNTKIFRIFSFIFPTRGVRNAPRSGIATINAGE